MKSPITNFLPFDLETTGLFKEKNAIIEVACCPFDFELNDLPEFQSGVMAVYDNRFIDPRALAANGVSESQIKNGADSKETMERLIKYFVSLASKGSKPVLCGHNIDKFDIPFMDDWFSFFGKDLSKYVNTDFTIDTMWWARAKRSEQENFKLGTCCQIEKIELTDAHRAVADTRANKELIKLYLRNMRSESVTTKTEGQFRKTFEF